MIRVRKLKSLILNNKRLIRSHRKNRRRMTMKKLRKIKNKRQSHLIKNQKSKRMLRIPKMIKTNNPHKNFNKTI